MANVSLGFSGSGVYLTLSVAIINRLNPTLRVYVVLQNNVKLYHLVFRQLLKAKSTDYIKIGD
jgi:hypothetical protein